MTTHYLATIDSIGCGRRFVDGTDFSRKLSSVTCGNCKRSKAYKTAETAHVEELHTAITEWRNGPRVIEYATTEAAYDATMSDDTIADGTVLIVRAEGVVGVLMNAWPVAVTASNGQFHHTINPRASGTDKAWDKATELATAMGFPIQAPTFSEQPELMARIRAVSARHAEVSRLWRVADDAETIAPFRTRGKVKSTSRARRFRKGA